MGNRGVDLGEREMGRTGRRGKCGQDVRDKNEN